ncbi:hypothetical protein B0T18DRAFT_427375 [Schizothecium vesticola]|uniref:DNA/RNA-binding domain-containing protein n=1 Tax=Schizothecium vesticola TaxID=314040 RepID=A0AA40K813_9PEZI|nr:hypothetical protein B0T18DRAFT_427375 [Schizothecium vesticola]
MSPAGAGESPQTSPRPPQWRNAGDPTTASAVKSQQRDSEPGAKTPESLKRAGSRSQSPPKRAKPQPASSQQPVDESRTEFNRGPLQNKGRLWNPDDASSPARPPAYERSNVATNRRLPVASNSPRRQGPQSHSQGSGSRPATQHDDSSTDLAKQPDTRPISQEQLVAEVKGIYAGLVMVENKCIEVDTAQSNNQQNDPNNTRLTNDQWQALIALHRTLLHEHHDFFLASQHPSASPALRRLASKYAMPARMWRHGIHSFLELLRHNLPSSLEHMLTFIYLAYSMMALLYETVPAFEETWIECLGDLGRYRMAIEDDNIRDREIWTDVSRAWYHKASDRAPTTGRLYHHLAILARPNALQQLFFYNKALCVAIPFVSARESIMTLFDPIMAAQTSKQSRLPATEHAFVKTHGIMFSNKNVEQLPETMDEFITSLDSHIARSTRRFLGPSYYMAIVNPCAIIGYGADSNPIYNIIKPTRPAEQQDQPMAGSGIDDQASKDLAKALRFWNRTNEVVLKRFGDPSILPYVHATLVFVYHLTFYPDAMALVAPTFPWKLLSLMLNTFQISGQSYARVESDRFPLPAKDDLSRCLPEDYAMSGLLWADKYYPSDWFMNDKTEDDERMLELASLSEERKIRSLFLGCRISRDSKCLRYNTESHLFSVSPEYDVELESIHASPTKSVDCGELPDAGVVG